VLDDPAVVRASEGFTTILIRRPEAYTFRRDAGDKAIPIPGIVVLDPEGKVLGFHDLAGPEAVKKLAALLGKLRR